MLSSPTAEHLIDPDIGDITERLDAQRARARSVCRWGPIIMLTAAAFAGGVMTGIWASVPLTVAACRNMTVS